MDIERSENEKVRYAKIYPFGVRAKGLIEIRTAYDEKTYDWREPEVSVRDIEVRGITAAEQLTKAFQMAEKIAREYKR